MISGCLKLSGKSAGDVSPQLSTAACAEPPAASIRGLFWLMLMFSRACKAFKEQVISGAKSNW